MAFLYDLEFDIRTLQNVWSQKLLERYKTPVIIYLQQNFLINMQIWIHMYNQKLLFCVYYHVHSQ